jgi:hypothetical protein
LLPVSLSLSQPVLVFTTQEHGFRLQTLLEKIDDIEYSILIIKATNGEVISSFCLKTKEFIIQIDIRCILCRSLV